MIVYLGADHRGFKLKEELKKWLTKWGYDFKDFGADKLNSFDDYTLFAEKVGSVVGNEHDSRGVLICGSGVGMDFAANKFDGVRASLGKSVGQIKSGRSDDDMNILVLASDFTNEEDAKMMVKTFLRTKFSGKERYKRRIEDIRRIEENN